MSTDLNHLNAKQPRAQQSTTDHASQVQHRPRITWPELKLPPINLHTVHRMVQVQSTLRD
jgi:hypothetical protein